MPHYRFACDKCGGGTEQWLSIHHEPDERPTVHADCGGNLKLVIMAVNTYGVGERGKATRKHDATESGWDRDMPAYKRLRREGHQPPSVDGCADLEARARSPFEIETGLRFGHMDRTLVEESTQAARESGWDPKEHARRGREEANA